LLVPFVKRGFDLLAISNVLDDGTVIEVNRDDYRPMAVHL
jgi:hypothetical protein